MTPPAAFIRAPWQTPGGVYRQLIEGPIEEPITILQALLRCGFNYAEGDPRVGLVSDFISVARAQVEHDTGLALLAQSWAVRISEWAGGVPGRIVVPAQTLPLVSITDAEGNPVEWQTYAGYIYFGVAALPMDLVIVSGWPDADTLKKEAPGLVQAVGLLTAHLATAGRDLATVGTIITETIQGYEAAIGPHRLMYLP